MRYRSTTIPASCAVAALTVYLFLFLKIETPNLRSAAELWNLGHLLVYFLIVSLIILSGRHWLSELGFFSALSIILMSAAFSGLLIETVQEKVGRERSLKDWVFDIAGAAIAFSLLVRSRSRLENISRAVLFLTPFLCFMPLAIAVYDEYRAAKQFPIISSFDSSLEKSRFTTELDFQLRNSELVVTFIPQPYATITWQYFPRDWRNYDSLVIQIFNPETSALNITCRIHDKLHEQNQRYSDRFNQQFSIPSGEQSVNIQLEDVENAPANRRMNMSKIYSFACFTIDLTENRTLVFNKIWLKK